MKAKSFILGCFFLTISCGTKDSKSQEKTQPHPSLDQSESSKTADTISFKDSKKEVYFEYNINEFIVNEKIVHYNIFDNHYTEPHTNQTIVFSDICNINALKDCIKKGDQWINHLLKGNNCFSIQKNPLYFIEGSEIKISMDGEASLFSNIYGDSLKIFELQIWNDQRMVLNHEVFVDSFYKEDPRGIYLANGHLSTETHKVPLKIESTGNYHIKLCNLMPSQTTIRRITITNYK